MCLPSMLYFYGMSGRSSKSLTMLFTIYALLSGCRLRDKDSRQHAGV